MEVTNAEQARMYVREWVGHGARGKRFIAWAADDMRRLAGMVERQAPERAQRFREAESVLRAA